jgi:hypothetical protein
MNSLSDVTGSLALTTMTFGTIANSEIGSKSFSGS